MTAFVSVLFVIFICFSKRDHFLTAVVLLCDVVEVEDSILTSVKSSA
jgi:hypothetical protein